MSGKIKVLPTSRVGVGPLAEMAQQLRSFLPGWEDTVQNSERGRAPADLQWDLEHLVRHDAEGVLVASIGSEVVGFIASFVRSRVLLISQLWVLPEHESGGAAQALVRRALLFGQRSGTSKVVFHALTPQQVALGLQFGLTPAAPLLRLLYPAEAARLLGHQLARLLPGAEVTAEATGRRAYFADLERLDRMVRGFARPMDHEYWLFTRNWSLAVVRDGERIQAYAYGAPGHCGPVVGTTEEATLAAVGWALQLATPPSLEQANSAPVELLIPAVFSRAFDHLLEVDPQVPAATWWMANEIPRSFSFLPAGLSLL
ncbi:MAG: GNAT family N-acetyltransferase [Thermoanaerobaculum sp.]|nr:GNAT family N-acetyltransferase [Thermoanaerobaculum sp.]